MKKALILILIASIAGGMPLPSYTVNIPETPVYSGGITEHGGGDNPTADLMKFAIENNAVAEFNEGEFYIALILCLAVGTLLISAGD